MGDEEGSVMKKISSEAWEKYYAAGKVIVVAKTPPRYNSVVSALLRSPGIIQLEPKFDFEKFHEGLVNNGIPPKDALNILKSLNLVEDDAYLVAREDIKISR